MKLELARVDSYENDTDELHFFCSDPETKKDHKKSYPMFACDHRSPYLGPRLRGHSMVRAHIYVHPSLHVDKGFFLIIVYLYIFIQSCIIIAIFFCLFCSLRDLI